ncbi:hypothetical protein ACQP1W_26780 [Spirillospora sp. CA-255316]
MAAYAARVAAYERGERAHPGSASCVVEDVVSRGTPVWSTTNDAGYEAMDELIRLGATGLLSDVLAVLKQLLDDINAKRFTTAGPQIAELRARVKADRKDQRGHALNQLEKHLHRAGTYVRAHESGRACGALDETSRGRRRPPTRRRSRPSAPSKARWATRATTPPSASATATAG